MHFSSTASSEGNVCNDALYVVGLHGPGGTKLSHGPGHAVPGNA